MTLREITIVFMDTETEVSLDLPVEISACSTINGQLQRQFSTLVDIGSPITAKSTAIHGISNEMIRKDNAPPLSLAVRCFSSWLKDADPDIVVAHNMKFDKRIMEKAAGVAGLDSVLFFMDYEMVDSLSIARRLLQMGRSADLLVQPKVVHDYKLETLREKFLHKSTPQSHRGSDDVSDLCGIFMHLIGFYEETGRNPDLTGFLSWYHTKNIPTVFTTSKYPGVPIVQVWKRSPQYCRWMLRLPDLDADLREGILNAKKEAGL